MALNYRKRVLLSETILKNCENCKKVFPEECKFCQTCGSKLTSQRSKVYANVSAKGITSITYKLPNGVTINSKGKLTVPVAQGLSYSSKIK